MIVAIRVDKWLWAARFFKTRSLAQQAVEGGKVRIGGERIKPAKEVRIGDELAIQIGVYQWTVRILQLSDKRGSAPVAQTLYSEDAASRQQREEQAALRKIAAEPAQDRHGRPTKRERRQLERWREG